eukprot:TRINITY_DN19319_c0_g1_i1.p1 TRINITY_DN19319_c0_g1~~TRINITY_DN19319_c0_g1_i1.p1  ORF type:complete len:217 (-),score=38.92 TRINITY_DN19319_c0_g1_i1:67-684(-)
MDVLLANALPPSAWASARNQQNGCAIQRSQSASALHSAKAAANKGLNSYRRPPVAALKMDHFSQPRQDVQKLDLQKQQQQGRQQSRCPPLKGLELARARSEAMMEQISSRYPKLSQRGREGADAVPGVSRNANQRRSVPRVNLGGVLSSGAGAPNPLSQRQPPPLSYRIEPLGCGRPAMHRNPSAPPGLNSARQPQQQQQRRPFY